MTAAKKKNSRRKQARFRSSRRKRIRNTVLLLLLFGCAWAVLGSVQFMFSEMELFLISWRMHM